MDVDIASGGANEVRYRWLEKSAHQCFLTQWDDDSHLTYYHLYLLKEENGRAKTGKQKATNKFDFGFFIVDFF